MDPIVIYNSQDTSRNFPAQCPQDGSVTFLNWNVDDRSAYLGPPPSVFPIVCCTVMASGSPSPNLVGLVVNPVSWAAANAIITEFDNQKDLQSIGLWGGWIAGQAVQGPLVEMFKQAVFTTNSLSAAAKINLALTFPLLDTYAASNPQAVALYWATLKSTPPVWLDQSTITYVEGLAHIYNIPLVLS